MMEIVGHVTDYVLSLLGISSEGDRAIYYSDSNLNHMRTYHPADFQKYGNQLTHILAYPDYVGQNPKDGSYVKEFLVDGDYVKVAVRLSHSGRYFARSLYVLNPRRAKNFIKKGTLKKT